MQKTFCLREVKSMLIRDETRVLSRVDASAKGVALGMTAFCQTNLRTIDTMRGLDASILFRMPQRSSACSAVRILTAKINEI
jgi:hypothetical protein